MFSQIIMLQYGENVTPDKVQLALQVLYIGGDGDDCVLVGHNDDVLTTCSVGTETAFRGDLLTKENFSNHAGY